MDSFEFFFSFYGLILGLSVVELVGGVARLIHDGQGVKRGWLTPLLAAFVAADITSFWSKAWRDLQTVEVGYASLFGSLLIAGLYYLAASLVFPRVLTPGTDLDAHFWRYRRPVLVAVMLCNVPLHVLSALQRNSNDSIAPLLIYYGALVVAALAPKGWQAAAGLWTALLLYGATVAADLLGGF